MLIRYPGSKEKLIPQIIQFLPIEVQSAPLFLSHNGLEYREPFFGAGALGFELLKNWPPNSSVWLNDIDFDLICMWQAVHKEIDRFIEMIEDFSPNTDSFYEFKNSNGSLNGDFTRIGFKKLALHQMSYSGLGVMSGGPIGGVNQDNELYKVDVRWSVPNLLKNARLCHNILSEKNNIKLTSGDFAKLLNDDSGGIFVYLDPPYFEKGPQLYKYSFSYDDHIRLRDSLITKTKMKWLLSYDDNQEIRDMYSWAYITELKATYTMYGGNRPKNKEVLIMPKYYIEELGYNK